MIFIIKGFRTIVFIFIVICGNNNKDEDNRPKTLNDKTNHYQQFIPQNSLPTTSNWIQFVFNHSFSDLSNYCSGINICRRMKLSSPYSNISLLPSCNSICHMEGGYSLYSRSCQCLAYRLHVALKAQPYIQLTKFFLSTGTIGRLKNEFLINNQSIKWRFNYKKKKKKKNRIFLLTYFFPVMSIYQYYTLMYLEELQ